MKALHLGILSFAIMQPQAVLAEYAVTSKLEGWFCSGFVFESCTLRDIDAISNEEGGQLFEFVSSLDSVSDYNELQGRCWLKNSPGHHAYKKLPDDKWEHLGVPDDFTFKCKRN